MAGGLRGGGRVERGEAVAGVEFYCLLLVVVKCDVFLLATVLLEGAPVVVFDLPPDEAGPSVF